VVAQATKSMSITTVTLISKTMSDTNVGQVALTISSTHVMEIITTKIVGAQTCWTIVTTGLQY